MERLLEVLEKSLNFTHTCLYEPCDLYGEEISCTVLICLRWWSCSRAHPVISHCSHLLLKCRVATNLSYWLKVQSWWFKNYIFAKKCILISFKILKYCFYYSFTLYYCAIFYSLDAGFFQYHPGAKHFEPRSGSTYCRAWSASKLFANVISRQQRSSLAGKELNTKLVDTTFWLNLGYS